MRVHQYTPNLYHCTQKGASSASVCTSTGPACTGAHASGMAPPASTIPRFMPEQPSFLTPQALEKLENELDYLKSEGRKEIEERIAEARSHGDLRENADYDAAKNDQGLMESRIRKLEFLIHTSEVREVQDTGKVEVGTVVSVVDSDGDEMDYFVAPQENKVPGMLLASPTSPLGGALLGAKIDDEVAYEAPAGTFTVKVKAIRPYED